MTARELIELCREQYPFVAVAESVAEEFLQMHKSCKAGMLVCCFMDYVLSQNLAEEVQL